MRSLIEDAVIEVCAQFGLSRPQTAILIGRSRSHVALHGRQMATRFAGRPGCNSEAAQRGWETRRANGWRWVRAVGPVRHVR